MTRTPALRPLHPPRSVVHAGGFTILELMVAMGIFTILGSMVVVFMQQSLNIFSAGTRESAMYDTLDAGLPQIREDLEAIFIGDQFDAPPPPPTDEQLQEGAKQPPPPKPPVIRLRAGQVKLLRETGGPVRDVYCPYFAFVMASASEWTDQQRRRGGERAGADVKPYTPEFVESDKDHAYLPMGGLTEVLWIGVPEFDNPSVMTIYRGYRAPIGDENATLLEPEHFNTRAAIEKACRPVIRGVLHFGALWRRSFADSFDPSSVVARGETDGYVGYRWDSTRGLDPKFPFYRKGSAGDPSDDMFPAFVRLELTMLREDTFGFGRGEVMLKGAVDEDDRQIVVSNLVPLQAPGQGSSRYLKIGTEWMGYDMISIDNVKRTLRVRRGRRGTKKAPHADRDWIFVGTPSTTVLQLSFRDRFAKVGGS